MSGDVADLIADVLASRGVDPTAHNAKQLVFNAVRRHAMGSDMLPDSPQNSLRRQQDEALARLAIRNSEACTADGD
jgi:hypothetical protein